MDRPGIPLMEHPAPAYACAGCGMAVVVSPRLPAPVRACGCHAPIIAHCDAVVTAHNLAGAG
ncbi:MAG: hypothetical protein RLZZ127_62 [Planctomycetota bacterium]|jgi:hypothetical protein